MISADVMARARARERRFMLVLLGVIAASFVIGGLVGWFRIHDSGRTVTASPLTATLIILTPPIFLGVLWGSLLYARHRGVGWLQTQPLWAVRSRDRKPFLRAIRTGEHLSGEDEQIAQAAARHMIVSSPWTLVMMCGGWALVGIAMLLVLLDGEQGSSVWIFAGLSVVVAVFVPTSLRNVRRARRYLGPVPDQVR